MGKTSKRVDAATVVDLRPVDAELRSLLAMPSLQKQLPYRFSTTGFGADG